jgi:two-component system chemotaxis sensor kinase CheA
MSNNDEILCEFLIESREYLDKLDREIVALEENPEDKSLINSVFRSIHTIKGTCGFLEFKKLESLTHVGESLLDSLRAGRVKLDKNVASALLELLDATRTILEMIEEHGTEPDELDCTKLRNTLITLNSSSTDPAPDIAPAVEMKAKGGETPKELESIDQDEKSVKAVETREQGGEGAGDAEIVAGSEAQISVYESGEQVVGEEDDILKTLEKIEAHNREISGGEKGDDEHSSPKTPVELPDSNESSGEDLANYELLDELLGTPVDEIKKTPKTSAMSGETVTSVKKEAEAVSPAIAAEPPAPAPIAAADPVKVVPLAGTETPNQKSTPQSAEPGHHTTASLSADKPVRREAVESPTEKAPEKEELLARSPAAGGGSGVADSSIRIDVSLLDTLMNLVGELVLARNQILQYTKTQNDSTFLSTTQRLNLITSELQEGIMKTRMQPILNVWTKFPRVVRDVSHQCGKEVRLDMEGKETELDRTILEAIKDPLTHIVRNSIDHGIETPAAREAAGKSREGRLLLRAFHDGGNVVIEISDDGRGLNTERIRAKALENGLISGEQASRMSEAEIHKLIFAPGFSTAEQVTNLSGRGVGMDVVRSNIERIGGCVDLASGQRTGTCIRIKIPLTLAIVPALIVSGSGGRFAIPQSSLVELVRIPGQNPRAELEEVEGAFFHRLRGNLLPLVFLNDQLKTMNIEEIFRRYQSEERSFNIVVVKAEEQQFGLVVDEVHDTEEIVVKPLGKQLKNLAVYAGATIMGDGRVALILDMPGLARKADVLGKEALQKKEETKKAAAEQSEGSKQSLLLATLGDGYRVGIPLDLVKRLEEFSEDKIERASGAQVVQYRGGIMPLICLDKMIASRQSHKSGHCQVVVFSQDGRNVGLIVDEILDIVEENVVVQQGSSRKGILGSAVIQKKVTDLLDIASVVDASELPSL